MSSVNATNGSSPSSVGSGIRGSFEGPLRSSINARRLKVAIVLIAADAVSTFVSTAVAIAAIASLSGHVAAPDLGITMGSALLLVSLHLVIGLYEGNSKNSVERFRLRSLAACLNGIVVTVSAVSEQAPVPWLALWTLLTIGITLIGMMAQTGARALLIRLRLWSAPALVAGCTAMRRDLVRLLEAQPEIGFRPVAYLGDPCSEEPDLALPAFRPTTQNSLIEVALVLSTGNSVEDAQWANELPFPTVIMLRHADEMQCLWLQSRAFGKVNGIEVRRNLLLPHNLLLKRILDLVLAVPISLLALPTVILLGILIKLMDGGPAIYSQVRIGRDGRPLRVVKLRTMYRDAESRLELFLANNPEACSEWNRCFKLSSDPRILPIIGSFLRKSSLDELPQLWNIIRGEMSFVGPRPFPTYHLASFDDEFQALRASVVPGLTGLWQISSRSDGDLHIQRSEDTFYIRNWSLWLDLYIILQTIPAVFAAKGAR